MKDQLIGGVLALFCGGIGASGFFLAWVWSALSTNPIDNLLPIGIILAGIIAFGGFLGLIASSDLFQNKIKTLQEFLNSHLNELSEHYKVKQIRFWRVYSGGYGLLVYFNQEVNAADIKQLILQLQTNFYEKIYLFSKFGLNKSGSLENKYWIYTLDKQTLQSDEILINNE